MGTRNRKTSSQTVSEAVPYTGPAKPTVYDPNWRSYDNLTEEQRAIFQAMPETCLQVARDLRHRKVLGALPTITPDMTLVQVQTAFDVAKAAVAAPYSVEQSVISNIGKTVKTQGDVIAAFAVITVV